MRLIAKTPRKIVIEVHITEIEKSGFDFIWDNIRTIYNIEEYEKFFVKEDKENNLIYIELILSELPTHTKGDGMGFGGHRLT